MKRTFVILALTLAGCGGPPPGAVSPEGTVVQTRLTGIHWLHTTFRGKHQRSPKDLNELRRFGETLPTQEGGPVVLTEEVLISARDQKPLVVHFDLGLPAQGTSDTDAILAHEQVGFEGRRFVVYAVSGKIEELGSEEFAAKSK